jgi:hypothetical protein
MKKSTQKTESLIPKGARLLPHRNLREGEATGHAHRALAPGVQLFSLDGTERLFVRVPEASLLTHEEHEAQVITPGEKETGGAREFDHFAEEARTVMD